MSAMSKASTTLSPLAALVVGSLGVVAIYRIGRGLTLVGSADDSMPEAIRSSPAPSIATTTSRG